MARTPQISEDLGDLMAQTFAGVIDPHQHAMDAVQDTLLGGLTNEQRGALLGLSTRTDAQTTFPDREDLIQKLASIYRTKYAKNTAYDVFSVSRELRPGMLGWKAYRMYESGEPTIIGDGGNANDVPSIQLRQDSETFDIVYMGLNVDHNFLEALADEAVPSRINSRAEKLAGASRAHQRKKNKLAWTRGPSGTKMYGMLDNPWVSRFIAQTQVGFSVTPADMKKLADYVISFTTELLEGWDIDLGPNRLAMSPRMLRVYRQTVVPDTSGMTIAQLLERDGGVTLMAVPELQNSGGTGFDAMIAFRDDVPENFEIMEVMDFMTLPQQSIGYKTTVPTVSGFGGMRIHEPLAAHIAIVQYAGSSILI